MKKLIYILKQFLPLTYTSNYKTTNGETKLAVWKQWFGKPFKIRHYNIVN